MFTIDENDRSRFQESSRKINDAYHHREVKSLPWLVFDTNYWLSGETPGMIPDDYFTSFKTLFDYQTGKIRQHLALFRDDYIPLLFPWYGTGVVPSALGSKIVFKDKMDPAIEGTVIREPADIKKLSLPDPQKDGLMPRVLGCIDYLRAHSDLPVSFTDCQGPLNIALSLCGVENLFIWMYDDPEAVHELMEFCTEALIAWVKVQKQHAGQPLEGGAFPHGILLPEGFGGVWLSDDDCTILSPALYKEFVVPYNSRVLQAFGGGTLHFCGSAEHQLENFLEMDGLTGVNNFCMGNFRQVAKMQAMFAGKLALMVCDFTPLHIEAYYKELFDILKPKGTIVASFVAPEFALLNGKYENVSRNGVQLAGQTAEIIGNHILRSGQ